LILCCSVFDWGSSLVPRLRKPGAILPRPLSHSIILSQCLGKSCNFQTRSNYFRHKWRSHRSRYVLPSFSDRSQHIVIGRALPSIVTFQYATVCTEMVPCVSFDSSVQYRWLELCSVWDKVISNWCHLTIYTAMCVLHRRKLIFTQLYWTGGG